MAKPEWRRSSYSGNTGGSDCVEVGFVDDGVAVRDSKNARGPQLAVDVTAWRRFLDALS